MASAETTGTGTIRVFIFCVVAFFTLPFSHQYLTCCFFLLDSIKPQDEETEAPPSAMIISSPTAKEQAIKGSTTEAVTPLPMKKDY
jgi:hypothetical protein